MTTQPTRHFPVHPNLNQLRNLAKDLLKSIHRGDPESLAEIRAFSPQASDPPKLADAQFVLARSYGIASWPRLVTACNLIDAIWADDVELVREIVLRDPRLLTEDARGVKGNWGPPMSYAANLGRNEIVEMLRSIGADDVQFAFERACLRGQLDTARRLYLMGARPQPGSVMGPCETLNGEGLALQLELGARFEDTEGDRVAPVGLILQTYCRNPEGKHRCLAIAEREGIEFPDTPPVALHRGRRDLLEAHLAKDPNLFSRTFTHHEIFPLELGCSADPTYALHGTPLGGATLLHMAIDYNELELFTWMLEQGAPVDAAASIDDEGFGGHTPLFSCVVWQPASSGQSGAVQYAEMLIARGATLNWRCSLRKAMRFIDDDTEYSYLDVTPRSWGEQFRARDWVSKPALDRIVDGGGIS
jgi:hypothetical protein